MNSLLLVDDEAIICVELRRRLEHFGYKVEIAHTFESALRFCSNAPFDAILVEFNLRSDRRTHPRAGMGIKLVRQMRALNVVVPILMLTAMEGELYETASFDAGADDFITKTGGFPSFLSRLRSHIPGTNDSGPHIPKITAERVLVNADTSVHPDLLNSRFGYVSISRASHEATIFTDDMSKLSPQLSADVSKTSALEISPMQSVAQGIGMGI